MGRIIVNVVCGSGGVTGSLEFSVYECASTRVLTAHTNPVQTPPHGVDGLTGRASTKVLTTEPNAYVHGMLSTAWENNCKPRVRKA